ncbi:riboflavin synthase [Bythopirellula polymerisocia]|uniref:Riboflavin synthase n=1 Tax=Bythopirellula polymerisocia TaxID=2528003 RepID=A0A5C6CFX0_9BACT|nr:riboflavin synthase [Bythopirellula polymerisocia]TWU23530.1 Riboflavin synthase [Bythopirellula polymerisocia]
MFTGLVESLATVRALVSQGPGVRLEIIDALTAARSAVGDSIAINGCCLTVVSLDDESLAFEAGEETLQRTTLGKVGVGDRVNLETSLCLGDELGGHLVTGHIDGVGTVEERIDDAEWSKFWFHVPGDLTRQMASKGSVAVDGVSLTLVDVERNRFSVALIPHTLKVTTLGLKQEGDSVNLETDVLAKYVARQLAWQSEK